MATGPTLFSIFHFSVITDSHAVLGTNTKKFWFPSCITVYSFTTRKLTVIQSTDLIQMTPFYMHSCACLALCLCITDTDSCKLWQSGERTLPPSLCQFLPPSPTAPSGHHQSVLHLHNVVISRMSDKCHHTVGKLLRLAFFSPHHNYSFEIHSSCWVYQ